VQRAAAAQRAGAGARAANHPQLAEGYERSWPWHIVRGMSWEQIVAGATRTTPNPPRVSARLWRAVWQPLAEGIHAGKEEAWKACMVLPTWLLALPPQAKAARIELTANLKSWIAGDWERLAEQARATAQAATTSGSNRPRIGSRDSTTRYVVRLVESGQLSKAARVLSQPDAVITEITTSLVDALKRKNPPADHPTPALPLPPEANDCAVDPEDIARAMMRMNRHAAPDMFGWRAEHLQELPPDVRALIARALAAIAARPQLIPPSLRPYIAGARQVPLRKPDGLGIRPIAVGCLFRRIVAKAMAAACRTAIAQALEPLQLGLSAGAGTEQALHRLRMVHAASGAGAVFAELDATNAFNTVDRATVIREVDRVVPGIAAWVRLCYEQPSLLVVRATEGLVWYESARGVQQGDPLGPALFALAHYTALRAAAQERRGVVTAVAYLDDVGVVGMPADVSHFARGPGSRVQAHRPQGQLGKVIRGPGDPRGAEGRGAAALPRRPVLHRRTAPATAR